LSVFLKFETSLKVFATLQECFRGWGVQFLSGQSVETNHCVIRNNRRGCSLAATVWHVCYVHSSSWW